MKTNLEKFNFYYDKAMIRCNKFISEILPETPEKIYEVQSYKYRELIVVGIYYRPEGVYIIDKPSRKDVERIKNFCELQPVLTIDRIYVNYEDRYNGWKVCGAFSLSQILNNERLSFKLEDLNELIAENKRLYEPRNGYTACDYCSKIIKNEDIYHRKLIFRDSRNGRQFVNERIGDYCNSECAMHDQFAHEG